MTQKCTYLVDRFEIVGPGLHGKVIPQECLRPENHTGAHLIRNTRGEYVVWERDPCRLNPCEGCDSEDPDDECLAFGIVSAEEAQLLITSSEYEGVE